MVHRPQVWPENTADRVLPHVQRLAATEKNSSLRFNSRALLPGMAKRLREVHARLCCTNGSQLSQRGLQRRWASQPQSWLAPLQKDEKLHWESSMAAKAAPQLLQTQCIRP